MSDRQRPGGSRLFVLMGIPWEATPHAWINPLIFILVGCVIAYGLEPGTSLRTMVPAGVGYGLLIYLTYILHGVGHIVGGKIVGAPMDANLITAVRHVNVYTGDQSVYPSRVHVMRALGGPFANLLTGLIALGLWAAFDAKELWLFAIASLITGVVSLLPIPTIDGWVVWGRILRSPKR